MSSSCSQLIDLLPDGVCSSYDNSERCSKYAVGRTPCRLDALRQCRRVNDRLHRCARDSPPRTLIAARTLETAAAFACANAGPLLAAGWHGSVYSLNDTAVVKIVRAGSQLARRLKMSSAHEAALRRSNASMLALESDPLRARLPLREIALARTMGEQNIGPAVLSAGECGGVEPPSGGLGGGARAGDGKNRAARWFATVTKRMDGNLESWLRAKPRTLAERQDAFAQLSALFARLRALGIIHEDIVPRNIMFAARRTDKAPDPEHGDIGRLKHERSDVSGRVDWRLIDFALAYSDGAGGFSRRELYDGSGCSLSDRIRWCADPQPTHCYWAHACGWNAAFSCGGAGDSKALSWLDLVLFNRPPNQTVAHRHCAIGYARFGSPADSVRSRFRQRQTHRHDLVSLPPLKQLAPAPAPSMPSAPQALTLAPIRRSQSSTFAGRTGQLGSSRQLGCAAERLLTGVPLSINLLGTSITAGIFHDTDHSLGHLIELALKRRFPASNVTVRSYGWPGVSAGFLSACVDRLLPVSADVNIIEYTGGEATGIRVARAVRYLDQILSRTCERSRPSAAMLLAPLDQACTKRVLQRVPFDKPRPSNSVRDGETAEHRLYASSLDANPLAT